MKRTLYFLQILIWLTLCTNVNSQTDTTNASKPKITPKPVLYGVLLSGMYYNLSDKISAPEKGFEMRMALLGANYQMNDKISTVMMLDFGRTTRAISVTDSVNPGKTTISFTEGSNYTAFLKEAKFIYSFTKNIEFTAGMMVTDQYAINRKFWEREYVVRTYQEEYYYGHPADFGAKLKLGIIKDKVNLHLSVFNGDGPFKRQLSTGDLQYGVFIETYPVKNMIFTLFGDYYKQGNNGSKFAQSAIAGLLGYKNEKLMFGAEYNAVKNPLFTDDFHQGYSFFGSYRFSKNFGVMGRYDYIEKSPTGVVKQDFAVAGIEYIYDKFRACLNFRNAIPNDNPQIWMSFYVKFI